MVGSERAGHRHEPVTTLFWAFGFASLFWAFVGAVVELPVRRARLGAQRRCSPRGSSSIGTLLPFICMVAALRHLPAPACRRGGDARAGARRGLRLGDPRRGARRGPDRRRDGASWRPSPGSSPAAPTWRRSWRPCVAEVERRWCSCCARCACAGNAVRMRRGWSRTLSRRDILRVRWCILVCLLGALALGVDCLRGRRRRRRRRWRDHCEYRRDDLLEPPASGRESRPVPGRAARRAAGARRRRGGKAGACTVKYVEARRLDGAGRHVGSGCDLGERPQGRDRTTTRSRYSASSTPARRRSRSRSPTRRGSCRSARPTRRWS